KLSIKSALSRERKRVAPLARQPLGARTTTTASPFSAHRFANSGRKRLGSFCLVKARMLDKDSRKRRASQGPQVIASASISPCRSQAATAAGRESNAGDVLNATMSCRAEYV